MTVRYQPQLVSWACCAVSYGELCTLMGVHLALITLLPSLAVIGCVGVGVPSGAWVLPLFHLELQGARQPGIPRHRPKMF